MDLTSISQEEYINTLISGNYNAVVVAKFPKEFFKPDVFYGQLKNYPLPIWKEEVHGSGQTTSSLDSNYIYRVYYKDKASDKTQFVENLNYSPVNDPVGRQFDNDQLMRFLDLRAEKLFDFGVARRKKTYEELCMEDLATKVWDYPVMCLKEDHCANKLNKTL